MRSVNFTLLRSRAPGYLPCRDGMAHDASELFTHFHAAMLRLRRAHLPFKLAAVNKEQ